MGVVYKAREMPQNRLVAIKVIREERLGTSARERFKTEASSLERLQHPNIVQLVTVGYFDDDGPYMVLELVECGSLRQLLLDKSRRRSWPSARAGAHLTEVLARAIHYAHERGIIHRDLKPANVLFTADGTPKVADFGLAKFFAEESRHTRTGDILGTVSYMAPEQAAGQSKYAGPPADIYALGAILYELLTGRPPFLGRSIDGTALDEVCSRPVVPPSRLVPKVPSDLETICLKCLEKEPHKRYASAGALADDLKRFLEAGQSTAGGQG
jgi:serine/threonine-protein kinase